MRTVSNASLRVLHVIDSLVAGGAERVLATVVRGLRDRGFLQAIHLLSGSGALQRLIPEDCPLFTGSGLAPLATSIQTFKPDAIQTWVDDAAVVATPLAAARGIPLLHRIPNISSAQYAKHSRGDLHVRRFRLALQNATGVSALSDAAADDAATYFDIPRPHVIYNGFPLACVPDAPVPPKAPGTVLIAAVGRLSIEKGHRHLLAALPPVLAEHPSVRCWLVGEGPLESDLRRQIETLRLQNVVTLQGYHEDVPAILSQVDLFVMPSMQEGFGNALLEAMVAGLPIVASDLAVVRHDILRDPSDGPAAAWLVPPGDVGALSNAIEAMVADPLVRREYGRRALAVGERFQASRMIDDFAAMYDRLLAWRRPA